MYRQESQDYYDTEDNFKKRHLSQASCEVTRSYLFLYYTTPYTKIGLPQAMQKLLINLSGSWWCKKE